MSETKYIEDPEDIRLNEDRELQQILGDPPRQLLHWGNTFILVGVLVFLALGWLIKYPDVVPSRVILTTQQPPIRVFAEAAGKLSEFRIQDNQEVEKGMTLAVLDNPADLKDVETLDSFLMEIQNIFTDLKIVEVEIPRNLKLGSLQKVYADFSKSFDEHIFFLKNNNTYQRINNLKAQIKKLEELNVAYNIQIKTLEEVAKIAQRELARNQELKTTGSISDTQLEKAEAEYLRNRHQQETLDNQIINNKLLIERTQMQILELDQNYDNGRSAGMFSIQEDITNIQSAIDYWKKTFLIKAPISGQVSLTRFRSAQQFINQNEQLLTIVPDADNKIIAKGVLPLFGSGKVKANMRANIRLDGYPYQEFGSIVCKVNNISLVPSGDGFVVELSVPQPMTTTYDNTIAFQQEMPGTANIITEDRRILERIFDQILSIVFNE